MVPGQEEVASSGNGFTVNQNMNEYEAEVLEPSCQRNNRESLNLVLD